MKIRRDVAAIPVRSAKETWRAIVDLVTDTDSVDRGQLDAASSILESLIVDELPRDVPIVFNGAGPRLVIYCLYDSKAMGASLDIDPLSFNPTAGEWRASAPCEADDVEWMNTGLRTRAPRIAVHEADKAPADSEKTTATKILQVDWEALKAP